MSLQKLVYEGPDPEQLLLDVWNEHGAKARISEPERIAKGGVFGFFAKTHYRVEVQAPARSSSRRTAPTASTTATTPTTPIAPTPTAAALASMIEETEDVYEPFTGAVDRARTEPSIVPRRTFDEVLAGVASSLGEEPTTSAHRNFQQLLDAEVPSAPPTSPTPPAPKAPTRAAVPIPQPAPGPTTAPAPAAPRRTAPAEVERPSFLPSSPAAPSLLRRAPVDAPLPILRLAGFPSRLLGLIESRHMSDFSLEAAFALLPPAAPLPAVPNSLIAVVGEERSALELARTIATLVGASTEEIAIATLKAGSASLKAFAPDLVVHDPAAAKALSPGWRHDRIGIVAVAARDTAVESSWARAMLRDLRPSATIALADARSKNEDLAMFLAGIGGVDALAVTGADTTVTPAQLLELAVPVAFLNGAPATGSNWATAVREAAARRSA